MGMRPASKSKTSKVVISISLITAVLSLALTVGACVLAYMATSHGDTFNIRDGFLAIFFVLIVISVNV